MNKPTTECWLWTGRLNHAGYGIVMIAGKMKRVHRLVFEALGKPIPKGLVIDHLCRNRACCNPAHMECVTIGENVMRGETLAAANAKKVVCPYGHPLAGENIYWEVPKSGAPKRHCRTCRNERVAIQNRKRSEQRALRKKNLHQKFIGETGNYPEHTSRHSRSATSMEVEAPAGAMGSAVVPETLLDRTLGLIFKS